jgi:serine/threonine protein kinase
VPDADPNGNGTRSFVALSEGTTISHYRIQRRISSGGMGEVYLAEDVELDRKVAVKFLRPSLCQDKECRLRFKREAQAAARLRHPNIITVFEVGEYSDRPYFVMEHVEGMSLKERIADETCSIDTAVELVLQVLEGTQAAHADGVTHRDIKPSNILIDLHGRAQIADFGLASVKGTDHLTRTGSTLGTVGYMSPEQVQGRATDQRTDLFSIGIVFYELLAGHNPFDRDSEAAILKAITDEEPEPIARYKANVSQELQHVLSKLLQKETKLRYQTAADVIADLLRYQSRKSGRLAAEPGRPSSRWWLFGFVLTAAVFCIAAAWVWLLRSPTTEWTEVDLRRITSDGKATAAALSPDGNLVAFAREDDGRQSLWMYQIATRSQIELVPPGKGMILTVRFSPDGNFVYFTQEIAGGTETLHRIPSLGGSATLILPNTNSAVDWSPDGKEICYLSFDAATGTSALVIAGQDGGSPRTVVQARAENRIISDPSWHPNDKLVACVKTSSIPVSHYSVVVYDTETGAEVWNSKPSHGSINSPLWLPDGSGLVYAVAENPMVRGHQIVLVDYPSGKTRYLTRDLCRYFSLALSGDGSRLLAVREDMATSILVGERSLLPELRKVSRSRSDGMHGVCWTPDDRLIFTSDDGKAINLWSMNKDGSARNLIVNGQPSVWDPHCSHTGQLVYVSDESGTPSLWTCNYEGNSLRQLTVGGPDYRPRLTPDNRWVLFESWEKGPLQVTRTSLVDGERRTLLDFNSHNVTVGPDRKQFACWYRESSEAPYKIGVFLIEDGSLVKSFEPTNQISTFRGMSLDWAPDGTGLFYLGMSAGAADLWFQSIEGGEPRLYLDLDFPAILDVEWSSDGKYLAVTSVDESKDVVLITKF